MNGAIGMWCCGINIEQNGCVCSECGYFTDKSLAEQGLLSKCPQCGAKMLEGIYDMFPRFLDIDYKEARK